MRQVFFLLMTFALSVGNYATSQQTDFFWSDKDLGTGAVNEPLVVSSKSIGDTGSLFLYYSTSGPAAADLDVGAFLDIATSRPGVIRFTNAETFDFPIVIPGSLSQPQRWLASDCSDGFGQTGAVSDDFINELGAFTLFPNSGIRADNKLFDQGYDSGADAFLFGRVDYEVIGTGHVKIHIGRGQVGIACCVPLSGPNTDGGFLDVAFGSALVSTLGSSVLGDVNLDGDIDFMDIFPFIRILLNGFYSSEADTNCDNFISFSDIQPLINLLRGVKGCQVIDPSEESTVPQSGLLGDANDDGFIDLLDVGCYRNLGRDCGFGNPNADIDGSGTVDFLDLCPFADILLDQN